MKAGVAAALMTAREASRLGLAGDVVVAAVADEEHASLGVQEALRRAAFIAAAGIPTVVFGPGGEGAHAVEEWVSLSDTEGVARTLVGLATRFRA